MTTRRTFSALSLALAASCATSHSSIRPTYVARPAPPDTSRYRTPLADYVVATGVPALRAVELPLSVREIRLTDSYSMIGGQPVPLLRVIEDHGVATGELAFVWIERPRWPRRYHATRCSEGADTSRVCVYVVPPASSPNWRQVAAHLDTLGAWQLNDRCEDNLGISDAGALIIERLESAHFGWYLCNAPRFRRQNAAGARAAAIYDYFTNITRAAAP